MCDMRQLHPYRWWQFRVLPDHETNGMVSELETWV